LVRYYKYVKRQQLTVIIGLPGSGKTHLLKSMLEMGEIDDYCDDYEFGPLKKLNPSISHADNKLLRNLKKSHRFAIADTRYCDKLERHKLEKALTEEFADLKFNYVYFENDPEKCTHNSIVRETGAAWHQRNLIEYYTKIYDIPKSAKTLSIVKL
jgi:energy-coupling factor transporter ATP-binding protein EcfA2